MRRLTPTQWSAWRLTSRQLRQYSDVGPATAAAIQEELPEVPVEVAAMVRRRNLSTVEVPRTLTDAVEASASGSRSTKLQRMEARHLTDSLKQLSRTPGKGGTTMNFGDAVSGKARQERRKKVKPTKQTLRELRRSPPISMLNDLEDGDDEPTEEELLDTKPAQQDNLRGAFGAELSGLGRIPSACDSY